MSLSLQQRRIVQEYISLGISRSTGKLEKLSGKSWGLMSAGTAQMTAVGMLSWFRRNKENHYAVKFDTDSEPLIEVLLMFSESSAKAITDAVIKPYGEKMRGLKNIVGLTIGEVSNILSHGVVGQLADAMETEIILSVPSVTQGPKVDLMAAAFESYDGRKDSLLMSHIELYSEKLMSECSIVTILNTKSVQSRLKPPAVT